MKQSQGEHTNFQIKVFQCPPGEWPLVLVCGTLRLACRHDVPHRALPFNALSQPEVASSTSGSCLPTNVHQLEMEQCTEKLNYGDWSISRSGLENLNLNSGVRPYSRAGPDGPAAAGRDLACVRLRVGVPAGESQSPATATWLAGRVGVIELEVVSASLRVTDRIGAWVKWVATDRVKPRAGWPERPESPSFCDYNSDMATHWTNENHDHRYDETHTHTHTHGMTRQNMMCD